MFHHVIARYKLLTRLLHIQHKMEKKK